jgi:hypothetical protein
MPTIEVLEARAVPTTVYWVGGNAPFPHDWSNAGNWSTNSVPGTITPFTPAQDVVVPGGLPYLVLDQDAEVASFTEANSANFIMPNLSPHGLHADGAITLNGFTTQGGGALSGTPITIGSTGSFTWVSGSIVGNLTNSGTISFLSTTAGSMNITGNFTQTSSGKLALKAYPNNPMRPYMMKAKAICSMAM